MKEAQRLKTGFWGSILCHILLLIFLSMTLTFYAAPKAKGGNETCEISLLSGGKSAGSQSTFMQPETEEVEQPPLVKPDDIVENTQKSREVTKKILPQIAKTEIKEAANVTDKGQEITTDNADSGNGGNGSGSDGGVGSGQGIENDIFGGSNFGLNDDGSYTALSPNGISYNIISETSAIYPDEARSIGYSRIVSVRTKMLVGLNGYVEKIEILNNAPNLGFEEAAYEALSKMRFEPIYYKGHNIKMYFEKTIYFQP